MSPAASTYFVKREFRFFGKRNWMVSFNGRDVAGFPDRGAALAMAVDEAGRTASLGRGTEVRVDDGEGFFLVECFAPRARDEEQPQDEAADRSEGLDDSGLP
jgi:hypothetical protein